MGWPANTSLWVTSSTTMRWMDRIAVPQAAASSVPTLAKKVRNVASKPRCAAIFNTPDCVSRSWDVASIGAGKGDGSLEDGVETLLVGRRGCGAKSAKLVEARDGLQRICAAFFARVSDIAGAPRSRLRMRRPLIGGAYI
jgi:hypothetical protein